MKDSHYSLYLISLSLLFSTVTNFRFGPIGLPELFGLIAIVLSLRKFRILLSSSFIISQLIIICLFVSLTLGSVITLVFQISSFSFRDFIAWVYIIFFFAAVIVNVNGNNESIIMISRIVSWMPLLLILILLAGIIGIVNIWFPDEEGFSIPFVSRFIGLSTNPNQIGIAISALPFLCIYSFLSHNKGYLRWFFLIFNLVALLIVAFFVSSNTVLVSWVIGATVALIFYLKNLIFRSPLFAITIFCFVLVVSILSFDFFTPYLDKGGDVGGRSEIWKTVPEVFLHSPVVGHGPGSHGGIGIPFEGWELHSVPLDLMSQGGLVLFLTFITLLICNFFLAVKSKSSIVLAVFFAILIESLTHNAIRHPIFWFYLLFPYFVFLCSRLR
jgi:O-antigen ligase